MAHDVFISCASKDKVIADAVCARLESRDIRCWIAPRDVRAGRSYGEEIIDAIHSSKVMVLVLSANANASPHIPKEIERAVSNGIPVIPLRVENVMPAKSLDYFISSVHWLDAITPPLEQHLDHLATTINAILDRPGEPVAPLPPPVPVPVVPPGVVQGGKRIFCTKCGADNSAEAYSCTRCGKDLRQRATDSPTAPGSIPNYLVFSILVTLGCCLPVGIAAIVYSGQVNTKLQAGDIAGALQASRNAKMWCWISFGIGLPLELLWIVGTIAQMANQ